MSGEFFQRKSLRSGQSDQKGLSASLRMAGLRQIRFHDLLRHTYTSLLIAQGENIKFIQSQLGHASIQTTLDRYGHLLPLKNYIGVGKRLDEKIFTVNEEEAVAEEAKGWK